MWSERSDIKCVLKFGSFLLLSQHALAASLLLQTRKSPLPQTATTVFDIVICNAVADFRALIAASCTSQTPGGK